MRHMASHSNDPGGSSPRYQWKGNALNSLSQPWFTEKCCDLGPLESSALLDSILDSRIHAMQATEWSSTRSCPVHVCVVSLALIPPPLLWLLLYHSHPAVLISHGSILLTIFAPIRIMYSSQWSSTHSCPVHVRAVPLPLILLPLLTYPTDIPLSRDASGSLARSLRGARLESVGGASLCRLGGGGSGI